MTQKKTRRGRRPAKPKREFPGIEAVPSGGVWKWRARITVDGRPVPGSLCYEGRGKKNDLAAQEKANADYQAMRTAHGQLPRRIATLLEALDAVEADARRRGVPESTIKKQLQSHGRFLLSFWKPSTKMSDIDLGEVLDFIRWARSDVDTNGEPKKVRHDNTLLQKDLPLLERAFGMTGIPSPVREAREKAGLVYIKTPVECLNANAAVQILRDIRSKPVRWKKGPRKGKARSFPEREHHADILMFFALTAIRSGEFGRVSADHVDLDRGIILVRAKVRSLPREAKIRKHLIPVVRRLVEHALREHLKGDNPDKLLVPGGMNTVSNICRRWKDRLGIKRLSGRLLRHTAITGSARKGATLDELQAFAGHASATTTARYIHAAEQHDSIALDAYGDEFGPTETDGSPP